MYHPSLSVCMSVGTVGLHYSNVSNVRCEVRHIDSYGVSSVCVFCFIL